MHLHYALHMHIHVIEFNKGQNKIDNSNFHRSILIAMNLLNLLLIYNICISICIFQYNPYLIQIKFNCVLYLVRCEMVDCAVC